MLLSQELTELLHNEIAVIMNDGMAYRGQLERFDNEVIVLTQVFETTGRNPRPDDTWVSVAAHGRLLLSIGSGLGGGSMIALDVQSALEAILQAASSR